VPQTIFLGVVVRWCSLIFVNIGVGLWHRFDLETFKAAALEVAAREACALDKVQEVES